MLSYPPGIGATLRQRGTMFTVISKYPEFNHKEPNKAAEWNKFEGLLKQHLEKYCLNAQQKSRPVDGYSVHTSMGAQQSKRLLIPKHLHARLSTYPEVLGPNSKDSDGNSYPPESIIGINLHRELYVLRSRSADRALLNLEKQFRRDTQKDLVRIQSRPQRLGSRSFGASRQANFSDLLLTLDAFQKCWWLIKQAKF